MKISVVTSTRADFGILLPLIKALEVADFAELTVIATGSHFDHSRGYTFDEIHQAGIERVIALEVDTSDTSELGVALTASDSLQLMSNALSENRPDLVVVLGDRYEILSVAFAAFLQKVPIAHISGGDLTLGALDDSIRHSITKLASLHFTTTESYRKRVIQLGEQPSKVFNVGNLCIDNIKAVKPVTKQELECFLDFDLSVFSHNILVTLHPETTRSDQDELNQIFFSALSSLDDIGMIITYPNHDAGSESIITMIDALKKNHPEQVCVHQSLGMVRYHSLLNHVSAVVGNSSSGVTEVASYGIPTVDVGDRQKGRVRASSVIQCQYKEAEIVAAITSALGDSCQLNAKQAVNPYGDGDTANKIVNTLKHVVLTELKKKEFYDIKYHD